MRRGRFVLTKPDRRSQSSVEFVVDDAECVTDQWCDPGDYLEPLTGVPHSKLRVGAFRLGCTAVHTDQILRVYTIEKRPGVYKPGDD